TGRVSNYTAIYEMVKDSVVMIRVLGQVGSAVGSGFVYDTEGHIVTNNHVVGGGRVFRVVFSDGSMFTAKVVGTDVDSDLAVLKIENPPQGLKPLKLGDSSALKIGEEVIAIGNPFGLEGTLTTGVVSQKGRLLPTGRGFSIPGVIQTDAAINPGNSGGPLLNLRGEVVGVNTAIEPSGVGIGYAVPSSIVARVVPELIQKGSYKRSWMGISATTLDMDIAAAMGAKVQKGVLIVDVTANGPAHKAGLRGGDRNVVVNGVPVRVGGDIITAVDGTPVNSMDDFLLYMEEKTSPGQTITLTIFRGGETLNIQVTLGVRP
ncbi:MAG: trypsin-like peptidase domain-containing protein, partial [Candidatus Caldarchaeum sp.]